MGSSNQRETGYRDGAGSWMLKVTVYTVKQLRDPYYQGAAAETGFFFLLSLLPISALIFQVLSLLGITNRVLSLMIGSLPDETKDSITVRNILDMLLNSGKAGLSSFILLALTLWAASKLVFSLIRRSNYTYGLTEDVIGIGAYVRARIRSIITVSFLIAMGILWLLVLVYGQEGVNLLDSFINDHVDYSDHSTGWLFSLVKWPVFFITSVIFIAVFYKTLPSKMPKFREVLPGAVFSSVGILTGTFLYFLYFRFISHMSIIYGSLATIIALLIWSFWMGYIVIVGMVVNHSASRVRGEPVED